MRSFIRLRKMFASLLYIILLKRSCEQTQLNKTEPFMYILVTCAI